MKKQQIHLFGVNLQMLNVDDILSAVDLAFNNMKKVFISYCDFRILNYSRENYSAIYSNRETICYPDSSGVFITLKIFFRKFMNGFVKLVSTDINEDILKKCNESNAKIFLLGDTKKVLEKFKLNAEKKYSSLKVVGYSNGYNFDNDELIKRINDSEANVLFVGMGVPKQELWVNENYNKLNVNVIVTVGAFFSFISGEQKRAPELIRLLHFEWLYRLIKEPGRLWKRYFYEFPKFFLTVIIAKKSK